MIESKGDIESTALWKDIMDTIASGPKQTKMDIRAELHTTEADFVVMKVLEIEQECDYAGNFGPTMFIRFQLGLGDYTYKLYPYRQNLELSIKYIPYDEQAYEEYEKPPEAIRYKAIFDPRVNPQVTASRMAYQSYDSMNQSKLIEVRLELQMREFEPLRTKVFKDMTLVNVGIDKLVKTLLKGESDNVQVDGKNACDGVDMVEADNQELIKNVIIPTGMKIALLPSYIQDKVNGVYNAGCGTFFQRYKNKNLWFVYPMFNPARFDTDVDKVVFYAVPEGRFPAVNRTYKVDGKILYIAITGDKSYIDGAHLVDLNKGVGIRVADANAMMLKPVEITPDGPVGNRARLNTEIASRQRPDGNMYAQTYSASSNPFELYSELAESNLAKVTAVWENSLPELIYPGMPCKYVFMNQDEYVERKGIILYKYTQTALDGAPSTSFSYHTSTTLSLMLEPFEDISQKPVQNTFGTF